MAQDQDDAGGRLAPAGLGVTMTMQAGWLGIWSWLGSPFNRECGFCEAQDAKKELT